jgi:tight adherence protein C
VPEAVVARRIRRRRERMQGELPGALDLVAVIVEAGLGIDAALQRYAANADGPLADEFRLLALELRLAGSREEAFGRFAERVPFPETKAFVRAVAHSDRLGVSLGASLRAQAGEARYRRQQAAEEQANKAPVKMLFPMVFCIFPCLLVIVLGPPVLRLMGSL